ncbi:ubiquitin carboxyl-terminal hydrolase 23 isoform X1 [Daucus carota subsp. sativus]|uniref:ubiquitin carboxyl-terminal hydrolase 23 isoform X1 n=1 Tax=Daucus carota subsp. sativus TaxID=79200 RepID=UPI0007EF97A9|nr:PREDICTED: ubiquitin carboxyl-terminal hydrolase 23 isoform X1 [Daucus carota subsp. sativus]
MAATTKASKQSSLPELSISSPLFEKRIEFHIARKPFTGFSNSGGTFQLETLNPSTSNSSQFKSNSLVKKTDSVELKDNGFDPELSYQISFRRIGAGLMNLGNTCFLNSVLQCLTYTEPLAAYLQSGRHQLSCRTAGFCALCAIQKHVSSARQSTGRILAPKEIVSNLRCISRNFRNSRQEDAHEYMVNLLESMHKCCLPSGVPSESPSAYDKSSVHKIFGGRLRSQVKCMQCSYTSDKFDPFLDLSLEIVKADSLQRALTHFTAKEFLDGGEKHYQCQQCKQKVKALKQLTIYKAPYVLTIHLKRFSSHLAGQKIDKRIHFGTTLDLKPFVTDPCDGDLKYTLYGVLVHAGWSTHSGHYYCFVRTSSGMWYSLDDNRVIQVSEKMVLEQKAYMLFYYRERRNFSSNKSFDVQKHSTNSSEKVKLSCGFNQELKETLSGQTEKKVSGSISSAAIAQSNSLVGAVPGKPVIKDAAVECMTAKKDALVEHLSSQAGVECLLQKDSSANPTITAINEKAVECANNLINASNSDNVLKSGNGDALCDSGARLPKGSDYKNSEKGLHDAVAISTNSGLLDTCSRVAPEKAFSGEKSRCIPINKSNTLTTASATALNNFQVIKQATIPEISTPPIRKHKSMQKVHEEKSNRRLKKLPRCPTMKMQLSSKFICARKKKFKRSRKGKLVSAALIQKGPVHVDSIPLDLEPSTSYQTKLSGGLDHSQRGRKNFGSKKKENSGVVNNIVPNINNDSMTNNKVEIGGRSGQNGAILACNNPTEKFPVRASAGNLLDARGPCYPKDNTKESIQNGLMSVLTRDLEETKVARWDEIGTTDYTERSDVGNGSIGHVGDEWDEEYDRGKRKKVKSFVNDFGGPNPFQEIATMRTKSKKAKMDYSSSGNKPFRI